MDEAVVEYPQDWKLSEVQDVAERMRAGGTPSRTNKAYWGGDIPFALIEDITASGLYLEKATERISQEGLDASSAWVVPPGAVLLSMYATIGATVVNRIPVATNQAILAIQPKPGYSAEFLALCLRAHKDALSKLNVESTQKNISKGIVSTFKLPIPPLPEQQSIAQVLSTVQEAIEQQEGLIRTTTVLKQALMQKLFTEGLRGEAQKETEIGLVPESWEVDTVGSICRSIVPGRNKPKVFDGHIPWLTTPDIKDLDVLSSKVGGRRVSLEQIRASGGRLIPAQSVIMTCVGEFGISAVTEIECVINQQLHAFVCSDKINPIFLCNQLRFRKLFMQSIAHITTIPYLNKSKCESVPIALPPRAEQDEIANAFVRLDEKRDQHQKRLALYEDLFRTLLHELMTGKVRVGVMANNN